MQQLYSSLLLIAFAIISVTAKTYAQQEIPEPPVLISVSIDPSINKIKVTWSPSSTLGINGYIIERYFPNYKEYRQVDTVAANIYSWYDYDIDPSQQSYSYKVYTYKNNINSLHSDAHTSMKLWYVFDSCKNELYLYWTAYKGININRYQVLYEVNNGRYQAIKSININNSNKNKDTFNVVIPNYSDDQLVRFIIGAVKQSEYEPSIYSNYILAEIHYVRSPRIIRNTEIDASSGQINFKFFIDSISEIKHFQLFRYSNINYKDSLIVNDKYLDEIEFTVSISDNTANAAKNIYYYRLYALNDCGIYSKNSRGTSNILLNIENTGMINKLEWKIGDPIYENAQYEIYCSKRGDNFELVSTTTNKTFEHNIENDYITLLNSPSNPNAMGDFCYYVKTIVNLDTFNLQRTVISNTFCISIKPKIFCPTAFCPSSQITENTVFKPSIPGILKKYKLVIIDRWGEVIFQTDNYDEPWTGRLSNGIFAPSGNYYYQVEAELISGQKLEKVVGSVILFYK